MDEPLIRDISDTARWMAVFRARETERADAVFRDPFARALAGERGERIASALTFTEENAWSFTARTYLFDRFVTRLVQHGADMVVNLAAGLDTRPYRMALPPALQWIEVDLPELLDYKSEVLVGETPHCVLERVPLDLANAAARRDLFDRLSARSRKAMIVTEGLVVYLEAAEAASLAEDLARTPAFDRWALDMVSPKLLQMMQASAGMKSLQEAGAPLKFAPEEGPAFFERHGWSPVEVCSLLHAAARLKRLSLTMRLFALLPDTKGRRPTAPWGGVCLFSRRR